MYLFRRLRRVFCDGGDPIASSTLGVDNLHVIFIFLLSARLLLGRSKPRHNRSGFLVDLLSNVLTHMLRRGLVMYIMYGQRNAMKRGGREGRERERERATHLVSPLQNRLLFQNVLIIERLENVGYLGNELWMHLTNQFLKPNQQVLLGFLVFQNKLTRGGGMERERERERERDRERERKG